MLGDLTDAVRRLWSWRWPIARGRITGVDLYSEPRVSSADNVVLTVAYSFFVNEDGPYTGIRTWTSTHYRISDLKTVHSQFHEGDAVNIRYRADDPSENGLQVDSWKLK